MDNLTLLIELLPKELFNTIYMVTFSTLFAFLIGCPLAIVLTIAGEGGIAPARSVYNTLSLLVNVGRSIPFAILMIALIPVTRLIVGTSLGTTAAIVPLTLAAAPFMARLIEGALRGVDRGVIEAAQIMGATKRQLITSVFFPEALPAIVGALTLTCVNLIGYSAMAGLVGGGGLGKVAIQYGYQRFNGFIMIVTLILLLLLVEIVQWSGNRIVYRMNLKRGIK